MSSIRHRERLESRGFEPPVGMVWNGVATRLDFPAHPCPVSVRLVPMRSVSRNGVCLPLICVHECRMLGVETVR